MILLVVKTIVVRKTVDRFSVHRFESYTLRKSKTLQLMNVHSFINYLEATNAVDNNTEKEIKDRQFRWVLSNIGRQLSGSSNRFISYRSWVQSPFSQQIKKLIFGKQFSWFRTLVLGTRGRRFESCLPDKITKCPGRRSIDGYDAL